MNVIARFYVVLGILICVSCRTTKSELTSDQQMSCQVGIPAFLKDGQKISCEKAEPNVACPASAQLLDVEFKKACEDSGSKFLICGKCQDTQACETDVSSRFTYRKNGDRIVCEGRDPEVLCPAEAGLLDVAFKNDCEAAGGRTKLCGKCQDIQTCNINISSRFAYNKKGDRFICEGRDAYVACTAVATLLDLEFKKRCEEVGGMTKQCGKCQDIQACSAKIK